MLLLTNSSLSIQVRQKYREMLYVIFLTTFIMHPDILHLINNQSGVMEIQPPLEEQVLSSEIM